MPGLRQSAFWMVLTALLSLFGTTAFGAFTCLNPLNPWDDVFVVVDYGAKTCRISDFNQSPPTAPQNGVRFYTTGNLDDPNDAGTRFISYQQSVNGVITITGITLTSPQSTPISEGTTGINNYLNSTTKDFVGSRVIGNIYTISSNFGNFEFGVGDYDVSPSSITIDNGTPIVTNVTSSTADGTYRAGDQISINVSFDRPVFVTGTPQLTLSVGSNRISHYSSGTGTSTLTFTYTVQSGDISSDLEYSNTLALAVGQGGAIKDSVDTDANLALPAIGGPGSLSANKSIVIDAALPLVTGLSPTSGLGGGGTSVLISGSGFSGATAVKFGATNAASFTINSATSITVAAPPHASGTVNVTVTTPNGTSAAGAANQYTYYTTPDAPVIGTATAGDTQASVSFTAPVNNGGSPIISYTVTSSPGNFTGIGSASPLIITGLRNGTAYTFTVTATNGAGTSPASAASNAVTPTATQTITFADPGTQTFATSPTLTATATSSAAVTFTSSTTGVCTITSGGALTFVTAGNCTVNADQAGNTSFAAAQTVSRTFSVSAVVPAAPTMGAATAGSGQASVTFSPPANTGGSAIISYTVTSSPGNFTATGSTSPLTVTGLTNGTAYTFTVAAMTIAGTGAASAASNAVTPALTSTPSTELATKSDAIRQTLTDVATSSLTSALSANQAMLQDAKGRFVAGDTPDMALDVNGSLIANPVSVSSMGTFFGQTTQGNGTRQVVFGSFDVQRDDTTGASTATFNGKIAWERSVSETTLLGYFIGGDLARSNIAGSFTGDQDHLGVTAGGYAVHEMAKQLYLDGFVSVGAGRNNLTMDDGVLALESDYTTRSATFGMSVSGVIGPQGYEIWPELALTVGRTWIDTVAFTGTAYDTTDDSLSLDAGMVTLANLTFRPEFRVPLDGTEVSKSLRLITLAPRLICQQTTTTTTAQTCGGGAEIGLQTHSADGATTASAQILSDWINGQTRTSGQLSVEMRF